MLADQLSKLADEERAALNLDHLNSVLYPLATRSKGNVRKLGKLTEEVVSLLLVRAMLATPEDVGGLHASDPVEPPG